MELSKLFKNQSLLSRALTHRSWLNEHKEEQSNERMEFLGDAVLEFLVSEKIFKDFSDKQEGFLTTLRANLVNTVHLAKVAQKINLGVHLKLSKGEVETGGRENPSLLANAIEAVIGALYLDSGIEAARAFVNEYVLQDVNETLAKPLKDAKSRLQEIVQAKGKKAPKYKVVSEIGPDHNKKFIIAAIVEDKVLSTGEGKSKSLAQQDAAQKAIDSLTINT